MKKVHSIEHSYTQNVDISQDIREKEQKNFIEELRTVESYPLTKLYALKAYLTDYLVDHSTKFFYKNRLLIVDSHLKNVRNQLNYVNNILNTPDSYQMRAIKRQSGIYFERIIPYGRLASDSIDNEHRTGRIYPVLTSMPSLSRQVRSYLFGGYYTDVDLENSHPSILADSVIRYNRSAPYLLNYSSNREEMLQDIASTLGISRELAKREVLIALNAPKYNNRISLLKELHEEVSRLRLFLYLLHKNRKNDRGQKVPILQELERRPKFQEKSLLEKLITFQSYYCFDKESELLLNLREHLSKNLNLSSTQTFQDGATHLHFIPFYDGAYIAVKNDNDVTKLSEHMLETSVEDFNKKSNKLFQFRIKRIESGEFTYIDPKLLNSYSNLLSSKEYNSTHNFEISKSTLDLYLRGDPSVAQLVKSGFCDNFNDQVLKEYSFYGHRLRQAYKLGSFPKV